MHGWQWWGGTVCLCEGWCILFGWLCTYARGAITARAYGRLRVNKIGLLVKLAYFIKTLVQEWRPNISHLRKVFSTNQDDFCCIQPQAHGQFRKSSWQICVCEFTRICMMHVWVGCAFLNRLGQLVFGRLALGKREKTRRSNSFGGIFVAFYSHHRNLISNVKH